MDGTYYPFPGDSSFGAYDQSLELISEDFSVANQHDTRQEAPLRKPPRPQRQKSLTSEQTKHRRTRSGCYTCRLRRVKCDESRPICDRCRKGKRACTYPDKTATTSKAKAVTKSKSPSAGSRSPSSDDQDHDSQYPSQTPDDFEIESVSSRPTRADSKRSTIATFPDEVEDVSRRASGFVLEHTADWKSYSHDIKFYLEYFRDNITYCHYAFKHDPRDFLKTSFLEAATDFKPLLYSLTAFAAYHYALRNPDSKPERFLDYYDQSVSLFRQALASGNCSPVPVLFTMLQLATIEEFLGDWINLLNHQRAAAQLIKETYSPDAMTQTFTHRVILVWYWRFDLFAGVLSGNTMTLGREWFASCVDSCARAAARNTSEDLGVIFDGFFTNSRLLVTDVTLLFADYTAGRLVGAEFEKSVIQVWSRLQDHAARVEGAFRDVPYFNDIWTKAVDEECLTDFKDPHFMFTGPYFTMNYILVDSWSGRIMFTYRLMQLRRQGLYTLQEPQIEPGLIQELSLRKCKMVEAIQYSDQGPSGAVLGLQASLWIVSLFLPREQKYIDWTRRKLALIEINGYIYPASYRKWMSEIWGVDVNYWWIEGEGLTPLIRSMRQFIDFRSKSAQKPPDNRDVDVRDMNGIFGHLQLTSNSKSATTDMSK